MNVALVMNTPPAESEWPVEAVGPLAHLRIAGALQAAGHEVSAFEADPTLGFHLSRGGWDIAFNYARGVRGLYKAAYTPVTLDALGMPYTSGDALTLATCADKITLKELARRLRIQSPDAWLCNTLEEVHNQCDDRLSEPVIVKPNNFDLATGIFERCVCKSMGDLLVMAGEFFEVGLGPVLVERFVYGREIHCVILGTGPDAVPMPLVEVHLGRGLEVFGDEARTALAQGAPCAEFHAVKGLHPERAAALTAWALAIYRTVGMRDYGVVEFIVGQNGVPYLIEVNGIPDITPFGKTAPSVFEAALQLEGLELNDVITGALAAAVSRHGVVQRADSQIEMGFVGEDG